MEQWRREAEGWKEKAEAEVEGRRQEQKAWNREKESRQRKLEAEREERRKLIEVMQKIRIEPAASPREKQCEQEAWGWEATAGRGQLIRTETFDQQQSPPTRRRRETRGGQGEPYQYPQQNANTQTEQPRKLDDGNNNGGTNNNHNNNNYHNNAYQKTYNADGYNYYPEEWGNTRRQGAGIRQARPRSTTAAPIALSEEEWRAEKEEREGRKPNLYVEGITGNEREAITQLQQTVWDELKREVPVKSTKQRGRGRLFVMERAADKMMIMSRRGAWKGTKIWFEDDFTFREHQVQTWLRKVKQEEEARGKKAEVGYGKIKVSGCWWYWHEKRWELQDCEENEEE